MDHRQVGFVSHPRQIPRGVGIDAKSVFRVLFGCVHVCLGGAVDQRVCLGMLKRPSQSQPVCEVHRA